MEENDASGATKACAEPSKFNLTLEEEKRKTAKNQRAIRKNHAEQEFIVVFVDPILRLFIHSGGEEDEEENVTKD